MLHLYQMTHTTNTTEHDMNTTNNDPASIRSTNPDHFHKELNEGLSGSGHKVWMVCTVNNVTGAWKWVERFDNKAEAESWMKWA